MANLGRRWRPTAGGEPERPNREPCAPRCRTTAATEPQHAKGTLTVRERIALLLDEGSFQEVERLCGHRVTGLDAEDKRQRTNCVVARTVIEELVDDGEHLEVHERWPPV